MAAGASGATMRAMTPIAHPPLYFTERWQYLPLRVDDYVTDGVELYRVLHVRDGYLAAGPSAVLENCRTLGVDVFGAGELARMSLRVVSATPAPAGPAPAAPSRGPRALRSPAR